MTIIIALDIGGTQIRGAAFRRGSIDPIKQQKTNTRGDGEVFERICDLIQAIWPEHESVQTIVIALPGPLNPETGVIYSAPNIPSWHSFPIGPELEKRFGVPVKIGNDANLAALGEWHFGAGQGHHHVLYITISTGIGGGVINDGRLLLGTRGLAAEIGHITVDPSGPICSCGQYGHLESFASGPAIARYTREQIAAGVKSSLADKADLTARDISEAAGQGDELAIQALARAGTFLGKALASYLHMFNPSIVILGGGVSFSGKFLMDPIKESLVKHVMDQSYLADLVIAHAALGDNAGLMGALTLGLLPDN
jgi:glucokinase